VPAPGDYDNGEIGGMIGKGNRSTRRKPAPVQLCPPRTPQAARMRTRAAAVGSQRLTAELRHGLGYEIVQFLSHRSSVKSHFRVIDSTAPQFASLLLSRFVTRTLAS
jgi:hypothetical protein